MRDYIKDFISTKYFSKYLRFTTQIIRKIVQYFVKFDIAAISDNERTNTINISELTVSHLSQLNVLCLELILPLTHS